MPCGCSKNNKLDNSKKLDNNKKFDNNKILSLDSMASMSIDEIIDLYRNGYRLEGLGNNVDIVSLGCTGTPTTDIYRAMTQQGGIKIYKGTVGACKITPTSRCLDFILFYGARRYNTSYSLYFEIREHDPATGYPKGIPGDSVGLVKQITDVFETTFTAYPQAITFQAELPATGVPYWITIRSSDYVCGGGTTGYERVELSLASVPGNNRAYYGPVVPCGWSYPGSNDSWPMEVFKTTYTAPPVLNSISITPIAPSINIGYTQQFVASCLDQYSAPISCPTLTWSSSNSFAPINSSGLATGNGAGTSNISCTGGGKTSNTAVLTVVKVVYSITISPLTASLNTGATQQLTAVCRDSGGAPLPSCPPLIWYTTNSSVATVNSSGLVTAGSTPGTANISCTGGGANSTAPSVITVIGPLDTITISPTPVSLNIGATQQLTAVCKDAGNTVITCPTLTWISDNPTVATVNTSGLVTAVSSGTANMSCSGGGKTSNLSAITVISPANITMQNITVGGVPCMSGCATTCSPSCPVIVNIVVTWANSGGSSGTFTPTVTIAGGTPIAGAQITVASGGTETTTFTGVSLPQGTPNVCVNTGIIT